MDTVWSLPAILGIALFIGIVTLVRLLLSPDQGFERRSRRDRRRGGKQPEFPLYDCDRVLVTEDRRKLSDRRSHRFIITVQKYPSSQ